ncbi:hypothetical protein L9F63_011924, partial [Diploptera punctata]
LSKIIEEDIRPHIQNTTKISKSVPVLGKSTSHYIINSYAKVNNLSLRNRYHRNINVINMTNYVCSHSMK